MRCRRESRARTEQDYGEAEVAASSYTKGYLYLRIVIHRDNSAYKESLLHCGLTVTTGLACMMFGGVAVMLMPEP